MTELASKERPILHVEIEALRDLMIRLLVAAGCERSSAETCAAVFLDADLRGFGVQGLDHSHTLIRRLRAGEINVKGRPRVVKETESTILVDGDWGLGQVNALFAVDLLIEKARKVGCCAAGIVNTSDFFMAGHYGERIARAGLVGMVFSDSLPLAHPHGGVERLLGTNAMVIAAPTAGEHPLVLDMSTTQLSSSRVRQAAYHDEEVPEGTGVDKDGNPTTRAWDIRNGGALAPLGGHKGFGLALCVALLAGPLVGAMVESAHRGWRDNTPEQPVPKGHFFLAVDPAAFGDPEAFKGKVSTYIDLIKASKKAPGVEEIRYPGERAFATRDRQMAEGTVELYEEVWSRIAELAEDLGVEMPDPA